MQPLQPIPIAGYGSGLINDKRPRLLIDDAFSRLENAYVYRERVEKREGMKYLGRLRRVFTALVITEQGSGMLTIIPDLLADASINVRATQPNAQIQPLTLILTVGGATFTDTLGTGILTAAGTGVSGTINYVTGQIALATSVDVSGQAITVSFAYFPGLPVMGILQQEIVGQNDELTIFFDTIYAYQNTTGAVDNFQEVSPVSPGITWTGTDSDFFWGANYRGTTEYDRLFFVTNFNRDINTGTYDPIRYRAGGAWIDFQPYLSRATPPNPAVDTILYQARIIIPYYGRLLMLNTWEGTESGGPNNSNNFFNRCRFSQIGNPLQTTVPLPVVDLAWRSDIFGKGGFIDAPVNEEIMCATFFKNTLIVGFEQSTWQLRYVGEYGLPFIWERISSDFGCESMNSSILFDQFVLQVGDRAITAATAVNVQRIDLQIPDTVFSFKNDEFGKARVQGIRNFQRELVYWCYVDISLDREPTWKFPNKSLLFNYRNNTYAQFRNSVTAFGTYQSPTGVTWDRTDISWDSDTPWSNPPNPEFPSIVSGNQQGFIHFYASDEAALFDEKSLFITNIDFSFTPVRITSPDHNLANKEWIQITGAVFGTPNAEASSINGRVFTILVRDSNTIDLYTWNVNTQDEDAYSNSSLSTYTGGGSISLFPKVDVQTKDFNPFEQRGSQLKLSYIDFLMDAFPQGVISVNIFVNAALSVIGNLLIGNKQVESALHYFGPITNATQANPCVITSPAHNLRNGNQITITDVLGMTQLNSNTYVVTYIDVNSFSINTDSSLFSAYVAGGNWACNNQNLYIPGSQYAWHRFFATTRGQYLRIQMTYDNNLMSNILTHRTDWVLEAMQLWVKPGGRNVF